MHYNTIDKLYLSNFRNLKCEKIEFSSGINCIFGKNGNGKTNLLEAIYYIINKKSFRKNTSFPQIISIECEQPEILMSAAFSVDGKLIPYSGKINPDGSQWYLDGKPTKRRISITTEFINPFDSYQFHNTASFRRNWMDSHISNLSKEYKTSISKITTALKQRNHLIYMRGSDYLGQIRAIDGELAKLSKYITDERVKFLDEIAKTCEKTFKIIFEEIHHLEIQLESKFKNLSVSQITKYFEDNLQKDLEIGKTKYGTHLDDYLVLMDGVNSFEYCSLGQQKMSFLSLIFAYIELFRYKFSTYPIVLVDDVSGELDSMRWKNLVNYLKDKQFQVLITTANENFKKELESITGAKNLFLDSGFVKEA